MRITPSWLVPGLLAALASPLLVPTPAARAADGPALPGNEDLRHLRAFNDPQLSPDGTRALLAVRESTADGARTHVWLVAVAGGPPRQLTFGGDDGKGSELHARWTGDGRGVLYFARRGGHAQLQHLSLSGGEPEVLSLRTRPTVDRSREPAVLIPALRAKPDAEAPELALEPEDFALSPDGHTLAISAPDPETPGETRLKEARADAQWVDHDPHGTRLYAYDLVTRSLRALGVPADVRAFEWSADGKHLAALAEGPNHESDLAPAHTAWLVEPGSTSAPRRIEAVPATADELHWSADGHAWLVLAQARRDAPPGYHDLYQIELATGGVTDLTADLDGSLFGGITPLADGGVLALVARGVEVIPQRFDPAPRAVPGAPSRPVTRALATNAAQGGWLWLASGGGQPTRLWFSRSLESTAKSLETPPLSPVELAGIAPRRVSWRSDGRRIEGLLYLPKAAKDGKVPLVVDVHGGPTEQHVDAFSPFVDFLVAQGWAVLRPNPRGSTGRGADFAAANRNDLGGGDYRDIIAGVDAVLKTDALDPHRLALIGYSYGGTMAGFAAGRSQRFRAVVSAAPVIDQVSEYGTEEDSSYDRWFYGRPWERLADAWRQSPLSLASRIRTPFLLLQGEDDTTDPPGQSAQMYRALRQAGAPVDYVTYPRADHPGLGEGLFGRPSAEPWHGFDARQRIIAFLQKAFDAPR